jgi:hypothetical protein
MSAAEPTPQSQRITLPSPEPFPCAPVTPKRYPGEYRIVNDEVVETEPQTRRSATAMAIRAL